MFGYIFFHFFIDQFFSEQNINIQEYYEYIIVVNITQKDMSKLQTSEELDRLFEEILRPLQSRNARQIFLVLRDSDIEYLTTYDIQPILEKNGNKLSKVELNNWLSSLQEAGLVQKADERGKPTTRSYKRRYTFDLWKLTKKGLDTSHMLEIFNRNITSQNVEKNREEKIENKEETQFEKIIDIKVKSFPDFSNISYKDFDTINSVYMNLILMKSLHAEENQDLLSLSKKTGLLPEKIIEFIKKHEKSNTNTLYQLSEIPMDLRGKILQTIGLSPKRNYSVSLSSEGKRTLSILSP